MTEPLDPVLADWRSAYRASVQARGPSGAHPSEDDWERLATDTLTPDARVALGDHVVTCEACLDMFRVVVNVRSRAAALDPAAVVPRPRDDEPDQPDARAHIVAPFTARPPAQAWPMPARWAIAASVAAAVGFAVWGTALQRREAAAVEALARRNPDAAPTAPSAASPTPVEPSTADVVRLERELADARLRIADLEATAASGRPLAVPGTPELDVGLLDLEPVDALRSGAPRSIAVTLPRASSRVALVLAVPGAEVGAARTVEIRDALGRVVWQGTGARVTPEHTVVLVVPRALLPAGRLTLQVRDPTRATSDALRFETQLEYR